MTETPSETKGRVRLTDVFVVLGMILTVLSLVIAAFLIDPVDRGELALFKQQFDQRLNDTNGRIDAVDQDVAALLESSQETTAAVVEVKTDVKWLRAWFEREAHPDGDRP